MARKIDLTQTHIMDGTYHCYNVSNGTNSPSMVPPPVKMNAWRNSKLVEIRVRRSGRQVGKVWYSNVTVKDAGLTRADIQKAVPNISSYALTRYFGQVEDGQEAAPEVEATPEPKPAPEPATVIPALLDLQNKNNPKSSPMKKVSEVESVEVDVTDEQKIIETIHSAEKFKPGFLKMSDMKWKLLVRTVLRGKNIMLTGPSGEGKTLSVHALKAALGRPFFYINLGNMQDPQTALIGKTHFKEGEGTHFEESYFVKALRTPNAIILLDEFSRLNDDAENILMSVLDYNQRYLRLTESEDSETVNVAEGVCFIATANMGNEYTSTKVLDRAMLDRFSRIEVDELDKKSRVSLMHELYPNVPKKKLQHIAELAHQIHVDYYSDSPRVENLISTRMCVETAEYLNDGFLLSEAAEVTIYPFFDRDGGDDSARTFVKMIIQKFGEETRPSVDGTTVEPDNDQPLFGEDDFDILK